MVQAEIITDSVVDDHSVAGVAYLSVRMFYPMPAVDSPEPGGPDPATVASLVRPLARHPLAVGLQLSIYDPQLDDAELPCGNVLVDLVARIYRSD